MVLVLTAVKVFAFTKVRVRGPLVPDPGASLEVEHIERAEIRVEGTAVGVSIRTGERELAFKASPVQGREFVAAVQAARAPLDAR
jgi:methyl coenzyme M reductase subunit D